MLSGMKSHKEWPRKSQSLNKGKTRVIFQIVTNSFSLLILVRSWSRHCFVIVFQTKIVRVTFVKRLFRREWYLFTEFRSFIIFYVVCLCNIRSLITMRDKRKVSVWTSMIHNIDSFILEYLTCLYTGNLHTFIQVVLYEVEIVVDQYLEGERLLLSCQEGKVINNCDIIRSFSPLHNLKFWNSKEYIILEFTFV